MKKRIVKIVAAIAFVALAFGNILVVSNNGANDISLENVKANALDPLEPPNQNRNDGVCHYCNWGTGVEFNCYNDHASGCYDIGCSYGYCQ
jgi:hypothetical protein